MTASHERRGLVPNRTQSPGSLAEQLEVLMVVLFDRPPVAHADDDGVRTLAEQRRLVIRNPGIFPKPP